MSVYTKRVRRPIVARHDGAVVVFGTGEGPVQGTSRAWRGLFMRSVSGECSLSEVFDIVMSQADEHEEAAIMEGMERLIRSYRERQER